MYLFCFWGIFEKMRDIVIPLGRGSKWEDNELRFSLRSVHKHLANVGRVFVIGEKPRFDHYVREPEAYEHGALNGNKSLLHVPFPDLHPNKERSIYEKILHACSLNMIKSPFLFMNDDHFLLQDFDANYFPSFHKADLSVAAQALPEHSLYRKTYERTRQTLVDRGLPTQNFDTHCPILYDADLFRHAMPQYEWNHPLAYTIKSLYANTLKIEGVLERDGKFAFVPTDQQMLRDYVTGRKFFSIGDHAVNEELATFLLTLYPEPSPWEV